MSANADESLATLVRRLRQARGLTQGQLATYARVGRSWLSRVESDRAAIKEPGYDALARVAAVLGVPAEDLLGPAGYRVGPAPRPPARATTDILREVLARAEQVEQFEAAIGSHVAELTPDEIAEIRRLIRKLRGQLPPDSAP